jgi:alpha-tubulin suppressor-like RCC1 family protein
MVAIDAGSDFSAALSKEGAIVCWGQPQQCEHSFPIDLNCIAIMCCADN